MSGQTAQRHYVKTQMLHRIANRPTKCKTVPAPASSDTGSPAMSSCRATSKPRLTWPVRLVYFINFLTLPFASVPSVAYAQPAREVWLAPNDNLHHPAPLDAGASDYMELFAADASWPAALPSVRVFKLYPYFASNASDDQLQHIFTFLRQHQIRLALEAGALTAPPKCGAATEGYGGQYLANLVRRFHDLGGQIDYLAMDEPLWFGYFYRGPRACTASIDELAANVAANIREIKKLMPSVRIGDVESGVGPGNDFEWASAMKRWALAFKAATGEPLAFLHFDLNWFRPWKGGIIAATRTMQEMGVPIGIIYNGNQSDGTDDDWAAHAEQHYLFFEQGGEVPDHAVFQTWVHNPTHVLPPNNPTSLTGIARNYLRLPTHLTAQRQGHDVAGLLVASNRTPMAGAEIRLEQRVTDAQMLHLVGTVPERSATALFALRLNTECGCSGFARVTIYRATLHQSDSPVRVRDVTSEPKAWNVNGTARHWIGSDVNFGPVLHIEAMPNQSGQVNSTPFPVVAGQVFDVNFRIAFAPGTEDAGFLAVIFLGPDGKEIKRLPLTLEAQWQPHGRTYTDASGRFRFAGVDDLIQRVTFAGDRGNRPSTATLGEAKPQ